MVNSFKIISITHRLAPLELIGKLHLDETHQHDYLVAAKLMLEFKEFMFLSTCNRVEFLIVTENEISDTVLTNLFSSINYLVEADKYTYFYFYRLYKGSPQILAIELAHISPSSLNTQTKSAFIG